MLSAQTAAEAHLPRKTQRKAATPLMYVHADVPRCGTYCAAISRTPP